MSIIPYNNFTVRDLSNVQQPYINSNSESGYFTGNTLGTIYSSSWRSLNTVLNTNNGIARISSTAAAALGNAGLTILNSGIYSINLSLFPTYTQDGSSNISFNFGTLNLGTTDTSDPSSNIVNAFGGVQPIGMNTYDPSNNPYSPGIISWVANGYSSANSTMSNFVKNPITYELSYNYFNAGNTGSVKAIPYSGICTTETTFILDSSATIFFNVSTNSTAGVIMGNCSFTLKLISSPFTVPVKTWRWSVRSAANGNGLPIATCNWRGVASSSSGQYLAVCAFNQQLMYISKDYGNTWTTNPAYNKSWLCVAVTSDGSLFYGAVYGGKIWKSTDYGNTWSETGSPVANYHGLSISCDGKYVAAAAFSTTVYISNNYGVSFDARTAPARLMFIYISNSGQYLFANDEGANTPTYRSSNYGVTWSASTGVQMSWKAVGGSIDAKYLYGYGGGGLARSLNFGATTTLIPTSAVAGGLGFASSSNGQYLAVGTSGNQLRTSSNYGNTWTTQNLPTLSFYGIASSSDGSRLIAIINGSTIVYTGVYS